MDLTKDEMFEWSRRKVGICLKCETKIEDVNPESRNAFCPMCERYFLCGLDVLLRKGIVKMKVDLLG